VRDKQEWTQIDAADVRTLPADGQHVMVEFADGKRVQGAYSAASGQFNFHGHSNDRKPRNLGGLRWRPLYAP
jgi:hypothetical protein